jgi:hypothetical protein
MTGKASPRAGFHALRGGDGSQAWRMHCSVEVDQGNQGFRYEKRISESYSQQTAVENDQYY